MPRSIIVRTGPVYQAAERLRQKRGAEWMAQQAVNSEEHGGVRLLVGTWDALAHAHTQSGGGDDHFFAINPFDLAWAALSPAVNILRQTLGPTYAAEFEKAAQRTQAWLKTPFGRRCRSNGGQGGGLFL
jgi:hypothetical protein